MFDAAFEPSGVGGGRQGGEPEVFDVAIVGGGPAGLSAAGVLARARLWVALFDEGRPGNAVESRMRGFLTRDGIAPLEFRRLALAELAQYPTLRYSPEPVTVLAEHAQRFRLGSANGQEVQARRVLCAVGLERRLPAVPGYLEHWGKSILHCPYCQGWDHRDQRLVVWGFDPQVPELALSLLSWSEQVTWLLPPELEPNPDLLRTCRARGVVLARGTVRAVASVDGRLTGLHLEDGRQIAGDAIFHRPAERLPAWLEQLGLEQRDQRISVDAEHRTSRPGIYAAGDIASPRSQAILAAADGHLAGIQLHQHLSRLGRPRQTRAPPPALVPHVGILGGLG